MPALKRLKNYLAPLPVILVTTRTKNDKKILDNIIPISWAGIVESAPHMINICISRGKYSWKTIKETKEFGVGIPGAKYIEQVDICGSVHGDKVDKFELVNFSKLEPEVIDAPLITECPINMECKLENIIEFKSHDMFVGSIVKTHVDPNFMMDNGEPDYKKIDILCYANGYYWTLGKIVEKLFYTKTRK